MNRSLLLRLIVALAASAAGLVAFSGCRSSAQDSSVPWSRPASWEGSLPGMGSGGP